MISQKPEGVEVCVRIRPLIDRENGKASVVFAPNDSAIEVTGKKLQLSCTYDKVFSPKATQEDVYRHVRRIAQHAVQGFNATLFAYGQTGSGKTHTLFGDYQNNSPAGAGIIPRAIADTFSQINQLGAGEEMAVFVSFLQVYNERVYDVLRDPGMQRPLQIHESERGLYVEGIAEYVVTSPEQCAAIIAAAAPHRAVRQTAMNEMSSRSHSIVQLTLERTKRENGQAYVAQRSKLNLVDLAGSEKWNDGAASVQAHAKELTTINLSLHTLGRCIAALADIADGKHAHVPYRDSTLTRMLQDSIGGNCKTFVVATLSPAEDCEAESVSTLQFADNAKRVMTYARKNTLGVPDHVVIAQLRTEVARLQRLIRDNGSAAARVLELEQEVARMRLSGDRGAQEALAGEALPADASQAAPAFTMRAPPALREAMEEFATEAAEAKVRAETSEELCGQYSACLRRVREAVAAFVDLEIEEDVLSDRCSNAFRSFESAKESIERQRSDRLTQALERATARVAERWAAVHSSAQARSGSRLSVRTVSTRVSAREDSGGAAEPSRGSALPPVSPSPPPPRSVQAEETARVSTSPIQTQPRTPAGKQTGRPNPIPSRAVDRPHSARSLQGGRAGLPPLGGSASQSSLPPPAPMPLLPSPPRAAGAVGRTTALAGVQYRVRGKLGATTVQDAPVTPQAPSGDPEDAPDDEEVALKRELAQAKRQAAKAKALAEWAEQKAARAREEAERVRTERERLAREEERRERQRQRRARQLKRRVEKYQQKKTRELQAVLQTMQEKTAAAAKKAKKGPVSKVSARSRKRRAAKVKALASARSALESADGGGEDEQKKKKSSGKAQKAPHPPVEEEEASGSSGSGSEDSDASGSTSSDDGSGSGSQSGSDSSDVSSTDDTDDSDTESDSSNRLPPFQFQGAAAQMAAYGQPNFAHYGSIGQPFMPQPQYTNAHANPTAAGYMANGYGQFSQPMQPHTSYGQGATAAFAMGERGSYAPALSADDGRVWSPPPLA